MLERENGLEPSTLCLGSMGPCKQSWPIVAPRTVIRSYAQNRAAMVVSFLADSRLPDDTIFLSSLKAMHPPLGKDH